MDESTPTTPKELPAILQSYPPLVRGRQELSVRIIKYTRSGPLLDIREIQRAPSGTTFTKKGITLGVSQLLKFREKIDEMIENMINSKPHEIFPPE